MTAVMHDIFGPGANFEKRVFRDFESLAEVISSLRRLGLKIVLTSGTFDLFHVGHSRYLEKAKERGDILIVGVDSDEKVRRRKGPHRPVVSEDERMEILCHVRHVDVLFLKNADDEKWLLVKTVAPDVLVTTKDAYNEEELKLLKGHCGELVILEPQATTSTTAKVRRILISPSNEIKTKLRSAVQEICNFLDELTGGSHD